MHDLWHELSHYFTHVDNKIFVSILHLFIPGKLTEEFFKGHRKRYIHPINLFFVVGIILPFIFGQIWKDASKGNSLNKGFIEDKSLYRNDLLFEMDSTVKHDTNRFDAETRIALDSFLRDKYKQTNASFSKEDTSVHGYNTQYYLIIDRLIDARTAIRLLNDTLFIDKNFMDKPVMQKRLEEYNSHLLKLQYDSIAILTKYAALTKLPFKEAETKLQAGSFGYNLGKSLASKTKKPKPLNIDSIMRYPADYDPIKTKLEKGRNTIKRDSINIGALLQKEIKIDEIDLILMDESELADKYHIEGWKEKLFLKQTKRFGKQGMEAVMKAYADKSVWYTIFTIITSAWFLLLIYRSQHKLYVEHIVFLIHYNCFSFIASALMLFRSDWSIYGSMVISFLFLIAAMKRFYKQSWGKSIVKGVLYYIVSAVFSSIVTLIGMFLSILLT